MSEILHINEDAFEETINNNKLVLVDFYATWCPPCKMLAPVLEQVQDELSDKVLIVKIDVDQNENIARRFKVMSIPTLIIFKNGDMKEVEVGYKDFGALVEFIKKHID